MFDFLPGRNESAINRRFTLVFGGNLIAFFEQPDRGFALLASWLLIKCLKNTFELGCLSLGFFQMRQKRGMKFE